jgi:hypothetical protein
VLVTNHVSAQKIAIITPSAGTNYYTSETIQVSAEISNPAYLHVNNVLTGYRKLKVGYNTASLYTPMNNVVSGGNTLLEITLCNFGSAIDWSKMQIRPQGSAAVPVSLAPYVAAVGGIGNTWKSIFIPLSAFDPTISFTQISLIELPYSASAGVFDIGISKIAFTGGSVPFIWFGQEHPVVSHNGNGGSGELVAQIVTPAQGNVALDHVEFFAGSQLMGSDNILPYNVSWVAAQTGNFDLSAKAYYVDGTFILSGMVSISVIVKPVSPLSIQVNNPLSGAIFNYPADILVSAQVTGFSNPDPAWMHITNVLTGYRKLKIGYTASSLYSPMVNVVAGGNTTIEITMKDITGNTNWSKIQIRPQSSTVAPVSLAPYITAVGGLSTEWKTITIPLSAFDPSINFTQLSLIELPYSLSAGNLDIGIQQIRFTGGSTPFLWFGGLKTDNSHNGNGGSGELVASIVPSAPGGPSVDHVDFFDDNLLINTDKTSPYEFNWASAIVGTHSVTAKLTDNQGLTGYSNAVPVQVNLANPNTVTLVVTFDAPPTNVVVEKSTLRYNKAFAYSFTLDDGLIDAFSVAYPLLNGGLISDNGIKYPGYFYSDGCGNSIPFTAGLSWYSVNSAGSDIHNNTPSYITWTQLSTLYKSGWSVFNHSYSHAAYGTTDYVNQIVQNTDYVKTKTGIEMTHFVVPSGDQGYVLPALANGMLSINGNNGAYRGSPNGYRIDQPIDFTNFKLYKMLVCDANQNTTNIMQKIDNAAALSINGQHYWWSDFTHHVGFQSYASSLLFPLFQYYMENIERLYGISGSDNIWMAPTQDVYEYLSTRDNCVVSQSLAGNVLTITVDYSSVPANLRTNALTLSIKADQNFNTVVAGGVQKYSFNGQGSNKIINVQWGKSLLKSADSKRENNQLNSNPKSEVEIDVWPNPISSRFSLRFSQPVEGETSISLIDQSGKTVYHTEQNCSKGETQLEIDLQGVDLKSGLYYVKTINSGIQLAVIKVIKN